MKERGENVQIDYVLEVFLIKERSFIPVLRPSKLKVDYEILL